MSLFSLALAADHGGSPLCSFPPFFFTSSPVISCLLVTDPRCDDASRGVCRGVLAVRGVLGAGLESRSHHDWSDLVDTTDDGANDAPVRLLRAVAAVVGRVL